MTDNLMFRTNIKIVTPKTVLKSFIISKFLLAQAPVKLRNFNFFLVFIQIFEMQITQKIIHKVHESSYFYGVRKNYLAHAFVVF